MQKREPLPDFGQELKPTSNILALTLNSLRTYVGSVQPPDMTGICTFVIHHAVETMRRAGLHDVARQVLVDEIRDLDLARRHSSKTPTTLHLVSRPEAS